VGAAAFLLVETALAGWTEHRQIVFGPFAPPGWRCSRRAASGVGLRAGQAMSAALTLTGLTEFAPCARPTM
jgi:hypothetical protein